MSHSRSADPFLEAAKEEARQSAAEGGLPIGSVIVHQGKVIGRGHNRRVQQNSVIRHAEMDCLENLGRIPPHIYRECTIYTTLSPCYMCSGAMLLFGIPKVVIGENRTILAADDFLRSKGVEVEIVDDTECYELMKTFITNKPEVWQEDIGNAGVSDLYAQAPDS